MSEIITPAYSINKPIIAINFSAGGADNSTGNSEWPEILLAQHSALDGEIKSVSHLLSKSRCRLIQLDARLKRLVKGLLTHLELEANFLTPILSASCVSSQQKENLNQGFDALFTACRATTEYIHSLKLKSGNGFVSDKQAERIGLFLDEIKKRLNDEGGLYSQMAEPQGVACAV